MTENLTKEELEGVLDKKRRTPDLYPIFCRAGQKWQLSRMPGSYPGYHRHKKD